MNPRNYLELVKYDFKYAYKKLTVDRLMEHEIEHINHEQNDYYWKPLFI